MATNFIRSTNPFGLVDPPAWFTAHMATFDAELVMFASMKDPVFRLARRCRFSQGVTPADVPNVANHPDTVFMTNRRLVPVTTIVPKAHWGTHVFEQLAARDIVKRGGWKRVVSEMEAGEQAKAIKDEAAHDDLGDQLGVDAYSSFKFRTGQRVSMAHTGSAVNRRNKTAPLLFGASGKPIFGATEDERARVQLVSR